MSETDFKLMQDRLSSFRIRQPIKPKKKIHAVKSKVYVPPSLKGYEDEDEDFAFMLADLDRFYEFCLERGYSMERVDSNNALENKLWDAYHRFYNYPNE